MTADGSMGSEDRCDSIMMIERMFAPAAEHTGGLPCRGTTTKLAAAMLLSGTVSAHAGSLNGNELLRTESLAAPSPRSGKRFSDARDERPRTASKRSFFLTRDREPANAPAQSGGYTMLLTSTSLPADQLQDRRETSEAKTSCHSDASLA
jgi:hypothetical protein